ncbi:hypothetical protein QR680_001326 [Steinernema hermaphroditum]|uniref:Uncharacterized protein n=1 Tax=Steinernema hermaphroditum TaxID=289476 RepID=A0AA39GZQ3_9BILA|nr:hypothetical protein QR680_001326 [Steinernema hermaphroditum]
MDRNPHPTCALVCRPRRHIGDCVRTVAVNLDISRETTTKQSCHSGLQLQFSHDIHYRIRDVWNDFAQATQSSPPHNHVNHFLALPLRRNCL